MYLAHMCELLGHGRVLTVDVQKRQVPEHPRITFVTGSSVAPDIVAEVRPAAAGERAMVVLDSDHHAPHVLAELRAYAPIVAEGCYLVVEDTNVNGHPVFPEFGPGPAEALHRFLQESDEFEVDRRREKFLVSFNPGGYLKRVKPAPPSTG